jgi:hypothetical protein
MNTGCSEKCKMSQEDKQPQNVPGQGKDRMAHKGSLVSDRLGIGAQFDLLAASGW